MKQQCRFDARVSHRLIAALHGTQKCLILNKRTRQTTEDFQQVLIAVLRHQHDQTAAGGCQRGMGKTGTFWGDQTHDRQFDTGRAAVQQDDLKIFDDL